MCIWVHHSLAIVLAVGVLTGCVSISTDLQPVNPDVQPALVGEDCSPIVLGFGFGHNTVAQAQKDNLRGEGKFDGFGTSSNPEKHTLRNLPATGKWFGQKDSRPLCWFLVRIAGSPSRRKKICCGCDVFTNFLLQMFAIRKKN